LSGTRIVAAKMMNDTAMAENFAVLTIDVNKRGSDAVTRPSLKRLTLVASRFAVIFGE